MQNGFPTSHRSGTAFYDVDFGRQAGFTGNVHRYGIYQNGQLVRSVYADPAGRKVAPAPAVKRLPVPQRNRSFGPGSFGISGTERASALRGLARILQSAVMRHGNRIVGVHWLGLVRAIGEQALLGIAEEVMRQASGLPASDNWLGEAIAEWDGLEWLRELVETLGPMIISTPVDPAAVDAAKLSPGAGWVQVGTWSNLSSYNAPHRHLESVAAFLSGTNVPYGGTPLSQFQALTDAGAHTRRAQHISNYATVTAAKTARQAWAMDLWQRTPPGAFVASYAMSHWVHPGPAPTPAPFLQRTVLPGTDPLRNYWPELQHHVWNSDQGYRDPITEPVTKFPGRTVTVTETGSVIDVPTETKPVRDPSRPGEKKAMILGAFGMRIWRAAMAVTETDDLVDAVWEALPAKCRAGAHNRTMQGKLYSLATCWDELDVAEAVGNVISNQIEDAIVGALARGAGAALEDAIGRRTSGIAL